MKILNTKLLATLSLLAIAITANAAKPDDAPGAAACNGLIVATGPVGKGYSKQFANMKAVCGNVVPMCESRTSGGLDNLGALSTKDADIAPAQLDTWSSMKPGDENIAGLEALMPLNHNYLHVVTATNGYIVKGDKKWMGMKEGDTIQVTIHRFSELKGKRVALVGSAQLLGRQLSKHLDYGFDPVDVATDAKAFEMVKAGTVAAALSVSGWPSGAVRDLTQESGLTLVPYDAPSTSDTYTVRPINYKGLGVYNNNSLAVPNLLFTRPFKEEKAGMVAALRQCLQDNLGKLKDGPYEAAWNEIKDLNQTYGVPKFVIPAASVAMSSDAAPTQAPTTAKRKK